MQLTTAGHRMPAEATARRLQFTQIPANRYPHLPPRRRDIRNHRQQDDLARM